MIRYSCPRCRTFLESPDQSAGAAVACPTCKGPLAVPPHSLYPTPDEPIKLPAASDEYGEILFICPRCQSTLKVPSRKAGKKGHCPTCRQRLLAPSSNAEALETVPSAEFSPVFAAGPAEFVELGNDYEPTGHLEGGVRRRGLGANLACLMLLSALVCVAMGIWWFVGSGKESLSQVLQNPPNTCREFVELLKGRGVRLEGWEPIQHDGSKGIRYPAVRVWRTFHAPQGELVLDEVLVVQYPTIKQAQEEAGTHPRAMAWNRFAIFPDARSSGELFEQIRRKL